MVLDSGHDDTFTAAVFEGAMLNHTLKRMYIGGSDLNDHLGYLLNETEK